MNTVDTLTDGHTSPLWGAAPAPDAGDEGTDDWLGCECLHPLTWVPAPAAPMDGVALRP